jgi:hypothetical protein
MLCNKRSWDLISPQNQGVRHGLDRMIEEWKRNWLQWLEETQDGGFLVSSLDVWKDMQAAIRKVDTVDEVLGEIRKLKIYLLRHVAQRLCYQKDEWDWEMIDGYINRRDESSRPNGEIWAEKLGCRQRLMWRGFLVQFLGSHRDLQRIEII